MKTYTKEEITLKYHSSCRKNNIMKKNDFEQIFEILHNAWDSEDDRKIGISCPEEFCLKDKDIVTHKVITLEGDNGKSHGQKGHRKSYLNFIFDLNNRLIEIVVYNPNKKEEYRY